MIPYHFAGITGTGKIILGSSPIDFDRLRGNPVPVSSCHNLIEYITHSPWMPMIYCNYNSCNWYIFLFFVPYHCLWSDTSKFTFSTIFSMWNVRQIFPEPILTETMANLPISEGTSLQILEHRITWSSLSSPSSVSCIFSSSSILGFFHIEITSGSADQLMPMPSNFEPSSSKVPTFPHKKWSQRYPISITWHHMWVMWAWLVACGLCFGRNPWVKCVGRNRMTFI